MRSGGAAGWATIFRHAPVGVLVLAFLLFLVGAGLIVGGVVFALGRSASGWALWAVLAATGVLAIYVALNFAYGRAWAWLVMVVLLTMFLLSGVLRALFGEGTPIAPAAEIIASLASLAYLNRSHVRRVFGR